MAIVVVGASAGAIDALGVILPALPASALTPVVVVVHVPAHRHSLLAEVFGRRCALPVHEVTDKEPVGPGIWFAPPDYHLLLEAEGTFALSADPPVNFSRPSIDVLFESAADAYPEGLVAVVLTGASSDGARGAMKIRDRGGFVVVQDPETADSRTMPASAVAMARPQLVGTLEEIRDFLKTALSEGSP